MLKINGKCAIVLPDGQDLFSKTNKALISIREYLMKTCDLKEVIHMPAGVFTYTSIKTCIFYFTKKKEGADILKTVTNASKTNSKNYKFVKEHQTTHVKFYDYDPYKDTKKLLIEVSIKNISNNTYSLNYVEYIENNKNSKNEEYDNGIAMKKLSDVCDIDYGTRIVKSKNVEGEYPVYGSGRAMFSTNSFNREGFNILIGRFALSPSCVRLINEKIFLNDSGLTVKPKTKKVIHKYIGYYLLHNQQKIYDCARGTAQKNLDMETFKDLKVPIPSLKQQKEIVEHCERIDEIIKKLENDIEHNKQQTQQYVDNIIKLKNVKQSHNVDDDSNSNGNSDSDGDSHSDSDSDSDDNIDDDIVDDDIVDDNVKVQSKKSTKNIGNGNGNGKGKGKESSNDEPKTVKIVKKTKKPIIKKK
jgi:type I restriction-modification system DNA methylase subunit